MKPKLLVFASGSKDGGGSGFENLVRNVTAAEIIGVVSNHEHGGVRERAERLGIPFIYFTGTTAEEYIEVAKDADFVALSGWLRLTKCLDPMTTFNIHPAPLPLFGGKNMYGIKTHGAVLEAYKRGEITHSAVSMHFVTDEFDAGPVFFRKDVPIEPTDTVETLAHRVNEAEHRYQPEITDKVVRGEISWDGIHLESLVGRIGI